jgi:ribokinase
MAGLSAIVVVGSSNTDMVIHTSRLPSPGETILGGNFFLFPGGKGANQAVAAARLGGSVALIARIGDDIFGQKTLNILREEKLNSHYIIIDKEHPSGTALITVDAKGENTIVVAQGANAHLSSNDISNSIKAIQHAKLILMQLEIPLETVSTTVKLAKSLQKKVILNPAPSATLPADVLQDLYLITPNRSETEQLTGFKIHNNESVQKAAEALVEKGVQNVVITLGSEGAYVHTDSSQRFIAGHKVKAVDTTAAGDVFNGALAVVLSEGGTLTDAVYFANHAAAQSVTRMGAQSSAPYRHEILTERK